MPSKFQGMGISFQYPDNWTLDEGDVLSGCRSVTLYSPGGAFWSVAIYPHSADPAQLAEAAVDAMRQEYEHIEAEEMCESLAGHEMIGYDLNFYCLDLTNTARIRCLRTEETTYAIFCQAEDREFDELEMVFRAITTSLLDRPEGRSDRG